MERSHERDLTLKMSNPVLLFPLKCLLVCFVSSRSLSCAATPSSVMLISGRMPHLLGLSSRTGGGDGKRSGGACGSLGELDLSLQIGAYVMRVVDDEVREWAVASPSEPALVVDELSPDPESSSASSAVPSTPKSVGLRSGFDTAGRSFRLRK